MNAGWPSIRHPNSCPTPVPEDIRAWMTELWELVYPQTNGQSYQNFPDPELSNWARAYYAQNLEGLIAVKSMWDPFDLFSQQQGFNPSDFKPKDRAS